ncbi:MAG: hypothetical protein EOP09_04200 [Proteobacteria bacterium]|nr:MAG: hypothetical protein EOP09_04200 [Pseudomonadota bacterium]
MYSQVHVDDLVEALVCTLNRPIEKAKSGQHYYITSDGMVSDEEIFRTYAQALGVKPRFFPMPTVFIGPVASLLNGVGKLRGKAFPLNSDKMNEILPDYWTCSSDRFRSEFAYHPSVKLEEGIRGTVAWYLEKKWL